ncbi:LURP1-like domain [Macleaya cordata]|uniref:LURP1-like domain n=1 Tax=Macleaya cordata TaxID=56857 RepID=A0A200QQB5_MACCD|nr:LURP1-like domain [Macleaya cordata]
MNQQNYPPVPNNYRQLPILNPSSSYVMGQPSSCPPPSGAVISPLFCAPYPVDLTIMRKLMKITADNLAVKDVNGNIIFHIKDEFTFFRDRRILLDAARNPIVTMQKKINSLHRRYQVFKGDSKNSKDLLFSVKESSYIQFRTKLHVFLATNTREDVCDFKIKGSWLERSCRVYAGDSNTMHKKHTVKSVMLGKDTFTVTVHPNIDYAFIVVLIVILDAINDAKSK